MNVNRVSIDTNILIYSLDRKEKKKHKAAIEVMEKVLTMDCVITLQALSEFYYAVTRKNIIQPKIALEQIQDWQILFPTVAAKPTTLIKAIKMIDNHSLSFWDAVLLATVREANVSILLSEDFNHSQVIDKVKVINPFRE